MKTLTATETRNRFEKLKRLRGICIRLEMYYYQNKNITMLELMQERLSKVVYEIEKTSIALKPFNDKILAEYQKSSVHNFLMNSKGLNGRQILMNKNDLYNLTKP